MNRVTIMLVAALAHVAAFADPVLSGIAVTQQRPWSPVTRISFNVSGTGGVAHRLSFTAYEGTRSLGVIPESVLSGDIYVDSDGAKSVSFDPASVDFLRAAGTVGDFRVGISSEAAGNILYKVIDLRYPRGTPWQTVYVTEADLNSGSKVVGVPGNSGTVTWDLSCMTNPVPGISSLVWTGCTNSAFSTGGVRFFNSHMIMRRVRGGTFTLGTGNLARSATVGDFWISIYTCTISQVDFWSGDEESEKGQVIPRRDKSYGQIRGLGCVWPEDGSRVSEDSLIALLRARTGIESFDLPTEAQWEYACRAGTTTKYYNNTDDASTLADIAWYGGGNEMMHRAGQKAPNAWGLYDMIGNLWEYVRDWYRSDASTYDSGWEPSGPVSERAIYRLVRGGSYASGAGNCTNFSRTGDAKTAPDPDEVGNIYGFRVIHTGW